ncbi:hypothetical protein MMC14_007254 [Varicellaria rhodocarpa]|nr:hypothetical protein [Varicellaria rhodocarpa]
MQLTLTLTTLFALVASSLAAPAASTCTTTLTHFPTMDLSPTTTIYQKTVTATSSVNCGGCKLTVTTENFGVGPAKHITATATSSASTTTTTVCAKSA